MAGYRNPRLDHSYHYPPELLELLVETIPLLVRSKDALINFFKGAGVSEDLLTEWRGRVAEDRKGVTKYEITRSLLGRLNDLHDAALAQRREVIRRIARFDDFSTCWDGDRLKAEGLVGRVRSVADIKDSFTRMNVERERERRERKAQANVELEAKRRQLRKIEDVQREFSALFGMTDPHRRGKALESVLDRLFACYEITVKEGFAVRGNGGEGIVEPIAGLIEFEGHVYLVEMTWWDKPIGTKEMAPHLVRVYNRGDVRGIFISASGYSEAAIVECRRASQQKVLILCHLEELVMLLEHKKDLKRLIRAKLIAAAGGREPFVRCVETI